MLQKKKREETKKENKKEESISRSTHAFGLVTRSSCHLIKMAQLVHNFCVRPQNKEIIWTNLP